MGGQDISGAQPVFRDPCEAGLTPTSSICAVTYMAVITQSFSMYLLWLGHKHRILLHVITVQTTEAWPMTHRAGHVLVIAQHLAA